MSERERKIYGLEAEPMEAQREKLSSLIGCWIPKLYWRQFDGFFDQAIVLEAERDKLKEEVATLGSVLGVEEMEADSERLDKLDLICDDHCDDFVWEWARGTSARKAIDGLNCKAMRGEPTEITDEEQDHE